jgi:hypothetical protein
MAPSIKSSFGLKKLATLKRKPTVQPSPVVELTVNPFTPVPIVTLVLLKAGSLEILAFEGAPALRIKPTFPV